MVDTKLADLTAISAVAGEDLLYAVDDPAGTPLDRKATITQLAAFLDDLAQTLTNKTISLTSNTVTGTSAELATAISDETGTSLLVFNTSPTLVTPILGTPTSGTLTNCTGLPITGITASTSAEFATLCSDETGTGLLVFGTSPTIVTPTIASFANANHDHLDAAGGGTITEAAISDLGSYITASSSDTLTNKTLNSFTNDIRADEIHLEVRNESGGTIVIGDAVFVSGYSVGQDLPLVSLADSSSSATMPAAGIVESSSIANNANGIIIISGRISGFDTSAFTAGDEIFISNVGTSTNTLTATRPTGTDLIESIGDVLRSHATLGVMEIETSGHAVSLPNIANTKIWIGDASGVPQEFALSGDVTMTAGGVTTVANGSHTHIETDISDLGAAIALVADKLDVFAATTSAELKTVISDETGSGLLVFGTSPTLITPLLGTPTSGVLTNCTGYLGDSSFVTTGTITSGTWTGTAIASANLDAQTMHLDTTQTVTGAKTFTTDITQKNDAATPVFFMESRRSSPIDDNILGKILIRGNDVALNPTDYAHIDFLSADVTGGTEDGAITFSALLNNFDSTFIRINPSGSGTIVFDGDLDMDISNILNATLITPALGTPASGVLTNCTGLPITGITTSTSAEFATLCSDETGSSLLVFNTSPTLVTPLLGTPTSGVLTNCTGLPVAGLADGTDGELITWDSSGVATTVPVGTASHPLVSNGVGAEPTFQDLGNWAKVVKSADETVSNSTTLQNDDELLFTVSANTTYHGVLFLLSNSSAVSDFKCAFSVPTAATIDWKGNGVDFSMNAVVVADGTTAIALGGGGNNRFTEQHFRVVVGANAGTVNFQWSQNTLEVSDTKCLEGSLMVVWQE